MNLLNKVSWVDTKFLLGNHASIAGTAAGSGTAVRIPEQFLC